MVADPARGGMSNPLVNVANGLVFHKIQGIYQTKINTNRLEPKTTRPNWVWLFEGKDTGGQATALFVENPSPGTRLWIKEKRGIWGTPRPGNEKSKWDSPAMRRRCTSWSKLRATGWSHGNVLTQSRNSSWVHRLNRARRQSLPIGRWCSIFNISNNMAIGTEYSTIDCKELTILNSITEQVEWAHTERATWFRESTRGADWWRDITSGDWTREETLGGAPHGYTFLDWTPGPGASGWLVQGTDE